MQNVDKFVNVDLKVTLGTVITWATYYNRTSGIKFVGAYFCQSKKKLNTIYLVELMNKFI